MKDNPRKTIGLVLCIGLAGILGLYVLFQAKNLIIGPTITITEPQDGATIPFHVVTISGIARNISEITLNDSPIFIDTKGVFSEKLIVEPGYSIIKVSAKDRFGRKITKLLRIVYNKESVPIETPVLETEVSTSTASSTPSN